jgi:hypothetical protein
MDNLSLGISFSSRLVRRHDGRSSLSYPAPLHLLKILAPTEKWPFWTRIGGRFQSESVAILNQNHWPDSTRICRSGPFYGIRPKEPGFPIKYLLGILNSNIFGWIIKTQSTNLRGGYIKFSKQYIGTAPIVPPDSAGPRKTQDLINLVDEIINLRKRFADIKIPHDKELFERQINVLTDQINELVCSLYGIKSNEIPQR